MWVSTLHTILMLQFSGTRLISAQTVFAPLKRLSWLSPFLSAPLETWTGRPLWAAVCSRAALGSRSSFILDPPEVSRRPLREANDMQADSSSARPVEQCTSFRIFASFGIHLHWQQVAGSRWGPRKCLLRNSSAPSHQRTQQGRTGVCWCAGGGGDKVVECFCWQAPTTYSDPSLLCLMDIWAPLVKVWGMVRRGWHEREAAVVVRGAWVGLVHGVSTQRLMECALKHCIEKNKQIRNN